MFGGIVKASTLVEESIVFAAISAICPGADVNAKSVRCKSRPTRERVVLVSPLVPDAGIIWIRSVDKGCPRIGTFGNILDAIEVSGSVVSEPGIVIGGRFDFSQSQ